MKIVAAAVASLVVIACPAQAQEANAMHNFKTMLSREDVRSVAPALDKYTQDRLLGDVWKRPGLNSRDRSIVTLAALIAREGLNVATDQALGHYTHEKNPVACAAGLATLQVIEEEALAERSRVLGDHALQRLRHMAKRHPLIGEVRGLGLLMGIELLRDKNGLARASEEAEQIMYAALSRGLNFKVTRGNILTLTPALTITQTELDQALDIVEGCLGEVETATVKH